MKQYLALTPKKLHRREREDTEKRSEARKRKDETSTSLKESTTTGTPARSGSLRFVHLCGQEFLASLSHFHGKQLCPLRFSFFSALSVFSAVQFSLELNCSAEDRSRSRRRPPPLNPS